MPAEGVRHDMEPLPADLLTRAAIYGANASGKSNVLAALNWLRLAARNSLRDWDDRNPTEPFALAPAQPSSFLISVLSGEEEYEYSLQLDGANIYSEELLQVFPGDDRRMIFRRIDAMIEFSDKSQSLTGVQELLTPTTLALTIFNRLRNQEVVPFAKTLLDIRSIDSGRGDVTGSGLNYIRRLFDEEVDYNILHGPRGRAEERSLVKEMLSFVDIGVSDISLNRESGRRIIRSNSDEIIYFPEIQLEHSGDGESFALPFRSESRGTRAWLNILGVVLPALRRGAVILVDELDAGLHPILCHELLQMFADSSVNRFGSQIIFSSHDVSLLDGLDLDEIWFTSKSSRGTTKLYPLTEFDEKQLAPVVGELGSAYIKGKFGSIPRLGLLPEFVANVSQLAEANEQ